MKEEEKKEDSKHGGSNTSSGAAHHVYVRSNEHGWVPARVVAVNEDKQEAVVSMEKYANEKTMMTSKTSEGIPKKKSFTVDLRDYEGGVLPLQNTTERGDLREYEDMVDLPYLHEASILYNLKKRHLEGKPYTRSGDVIVAMNPYHWYEHLYLPETQQYYAEKLLWQDLRDNSYNIMDGGSEGSPRSHIRQQLLPSLAPHIYETATLAYKGMALWGQPQSILVSGESGAGKTESVKLCMHHLTALQRGPPQQGSGHSTTTSREETTRVVQRVLDSNPLLEAFGNAQTRRNDNSSRFGRYTQLQFDRAIVSAAQSSRLRENDRINNGKVLRSQASPARLAGSTCEVYLLEKNRVVKHNPLEERNFHIFYELLAAPEAEKARIWEAGLKGATMDSFSYVGNTKTTCIEGVSDRDRFVETVEALETAGIAGAQLLELFRSLCVVLQLGNITFAPDPSDDDKSIITSEAELEKLVNIMGVSKETLRLALTERTMTTKDEVYKVPLIATAAKESCDGLAKDTYEKVFLWLVGTINRATCAEHNYDQHKGRNNNAYGVIGLLDIFGFEVFLLNRFEQLCINYANEKLQYKFTEDCFKLVELEYRTEGIPLAEISYNDNTDVLDLIEGKTGLLAMLNEECWRPQGNAAAFVNKALHQNKSAPSLIVNTMDRLSFGVHHYAGQVLYDADDFVTRNQDRLPTDLKECASMSSNSIISSQFAEKEVASPKGSRSSNSDIMAVTVWTKYKNQLSKLMAGLHQTESRYIRCIKPNAIKEPLLMEHDLTIAQLRSCGIVASITIARSAFPNRLLNKNVLSRFGGIWRKKGILPLRVKNSGGTFEEKWKEEAEDLLALALKSKKVVDPTTGQSTPCFIVGKTKSFFRAGALEHLEAERINGLDEMVTIIQRGVRSFLRNKDAIKARIAVRKRKQEHARLVREKQARMRAEKRARKARLAEDERAIAGRLQAERIELEERMALEDRLLVERLEREERERQAQAAADEQAWKENMEREEQERKQRMRDEARQKAALSEDELAKLSAEIAALRKKMEGMDKEADDKVKAAEDGCLRAKEEMKKCEADIDGFESERGVKREIMFCKAIFGNREKFIQELRRENKRLVKVFDRVEKKKTVIDENNKKLEKECNAVGAKFENCRSLNMSMDFLLDEAQETYDSTKFGNQALHLRVAKQTEQFSLMSQCRLESQHTLTAMVETIQADSNDWETKDTVTHLNINISREAYSKLQDVQRLQGERETEKVAQLSVTNFHQSFLVR